MDLTLDYSQASPSSFLNRVVTFQSAIEDVQLAGDFGLINKEPLVRQLLHFLTRAEEDDNAGDLLSASRRLDHIERILNRERGNEILEDAYQILLYDSEYLRAHL